MRNRLYGGVRGRKMKVGGNYFIFLLLDFETSISSLPFILSIQDGLTSMNGSLILILFYNLQTFLYRHVPPVARKQKLFCHKLQFTVKAHGRRSNAIRLPCIHIIIQGRFRCHRSWIIFDVYIFLPHCFLFDRQFCFLATTHPRDTFICCSFIGLR